MIRKLFRRKLYHYTTLETAIKILDSGEIKVIEDLKEKCDKLNINFVM